MKVSNWIFVTGAPRSGTTFVGLVLSTPVTVDYIHEPFNPDCGIPGFEQRYLYLKASTPQESPYRPLVEALQKYKVRLRSGIYPQDGRFKRILKRIVGSRGPFYLRLAKLNPFHESAVVKDPVGCLLAEYLTTEFGFKTTVLLRHPCAFVASTRRLGWDLESHLADVVSQRELVEDYFDDDIAFLRQRWNGPVESAAALWRALNRVLLRQARENSGILLVLHEELSRAPLKVFAKIFQHSDLPYTVRVERKIRRLTAPRNPADPRRGKVQDFARDSKAIHEKRLNELSLEERQTVFAITGDVANPYYDEASFVL